MGVEAETNAKLSPNWVEVEAGAELGNTPNNPEHVNMKAHAQNN